MYFALELDRGTMPVERKTLRQTSFLRKLLSYTFTRDERLYTKHFNMDNFRVLTLTTGKQGSKRIETILNAHQKHIGRKKKAGLFLFADRDQFERARKREGLLAMHWLNDYRKYVSIAG